MITKLYVCSDCDGEWGSQVMASRHKCTNQALKTEEKEKNNG